MILVNGYEVKQGTFPDGSLSTFAPIKKDEAVVGPFGKVSFIWKYENDAELFTLICLRRHYEPYGATLKMLYCPHARMDRVKNDTDVFTLKYFCEVINSLNFSKVTILDPHSNVAPALLNNVEIETTYPYIKTAIQKFSDEKGKDNVALYFPDAGAMKRYTEINFYLPYAYGNKCRNWDTGVLESQEGQNMGNVVGKDVLIIDDICCHGGTFLMAADVLLKAGAKSVSLYITHCENAIAEGKVFDSKIEKVYTTKSLNHTEEVKDKIIYVERSNF